MKKIFAVLVVMMAVLITGCTQQIDPGYVGKKVGTSGIQPEIYETGRTVVWPRERLVMINVSSELRQAPVKVIMNDRRTDDAGVEEHRIGLEMDFLVNIRYRLKDDERTINAMMRDMTLDNNTKSINAQMMYQKYGNMVVGRVTREVLGRYTPEEVLENLEPINQTLERDIRAGLQDSPIEVSSVSLGPITLPTVISERINQNKDTELSEAQARAQQRIDLLNKQNEIELARQQAVRERVDAQSLAEQNKILAQSVTPDVLELRRLQIREREIEMMRGTLGNGNSTIFIPYGAQETTAAQMRMYQK